MILYVENRGRHEHAFHFMTVTGAWTFTTVPPGSTVPIDTPMAAAVAVHHRAYGARERDDADAGSAPLIYWLEE
jgi:hypothetical protein